MLRKIFLSMLFAWCALPIFGVEVQFKLEAPDLKYDANAPIILYADFTIPKGEHIYSHDSKMGIPTTIDLTLPKGAKFEAVWPKAQNFTFMDTESVGYSDNLRVSYLIQLPKNFDKENLEISAKASWLSCSTFCVPGEAEGKISVKIIPSAERESTFVAIIFGAFLGGLILNLMPCVFPVLGLKIMSFASSASQSKMEKYLGALFYTLGIVLSFMALGAILLVLRGLGEELGWGFQLQNPKFCALMALLFLAMGLSFAGLYEIGAGFAGGLIGAEQSKKSAWKKHLASLGSGVLAVLVASPCTAPFMGSALGVALATDTSAAYTMSIFIALGFGMASPYLLLSISPHLARLMPRPGNWMNVLQKILSVPLLLTVVWLVWVYYTQGAQLPILFVAMAILTLSLWIFGRLYLPHKEPLTRAIGLFACVLGIGLSLYVINISEGEQEALFQAEYAWSQEKVESLLKKGRPVYVDFTASWCLTCVYNKQILHSEEMEKAFAAKNIAILIGDWTNKNPKISAELKKFGRAGVPLNLLYDPSSPDNPQVMPAILTKGALIEAVDKIK